MPRGPYSRSDRELKARIGRSAGGKAGYKQLIRELGLGGGRERRLLVEQLERMVARGELVRLEDQLWALPRPPQAEADGGPSAAAPVRTDGRWSAVEREGRSGRERLVSGRLDLHRDGFGFVRTENPGAGGVTGDIFIAPPDLNGAMGGDVVLVDEAPPGRDGRRSGRIARVLTRRHPTLVGIFHYARPQGRRTPRYPDMLLRGSADALGENFVRPLDEQAGGLIVIPPGAEALPEARQSPHRTLGEEALRRRSGWTEPSPDEDAPLEPKRSVTLDPRWPLEGLAVEVEITRFPQPGRPAVGRVVEVLGHPDDFGVDVEIVIRKHHIPHTFPATVLAEAQERAQLSPATLPADDAARREDFRDLSIVTIDGETARDFDDAVLVRDLPDGHTELQVHIADVSAYVTPGSALDTEARVRGNSVYFPDRAVPMLPHELSSGMCSLLPHEDRLVLSCIMHIDPAGEIASFRITEGVIRSARRCTYTSVQRCLNASPAAHAWNRSRGDTAITPEPTAEDIAERERIMLEQPELPAAFDRMLELALRLNAKRVRRGSIDFDLPEPVVEFDPDGNMKAIVRSERGWSHRLIEEFMLSANECVATWLEQQGIASLYRIHEMPDAKKILEFEETAAAFGQTLGIGSLPVRRLTMKSDRRESQRRVERGRGGTRTQATDIPERIPVTPQMYQRLVRRIAGDPEERILSYLMLRSLKQARYAEKNEGHFALASPSYTHFTSPIRRYPDLIIHRLLRIMLRRGADPRGGPIRSTDRQPWREEASSPHAATRARREDAQDPIPPAELEDIALECSQTERRAADAERELIEWKKMKFMADRVGDDFHAMVLSATRYGLFVELDDLFIEGLIPLASLTGDHWTFRDTDRTICGARSGFCFRPGQPVEVLLDRIDRVQRRLQFALLRGTEPYLGHTSGDAEARDGRKPLRSGKSPDRSGKPQKRSAKALKREKRAKRRRSS